MDNNYNVFRRATFGGFNRKDVIDYIEKIKNEFLEYKNGVEKTIAELQQQIASLTESARTHEDAVQAEPSQVSTPGESCDTIRLISAATSELRSVADELSKSLGDFMLTITQGDAPSQDTVASPEETVEPKKETKDTIGDIISGFCVVSDAIAVDTEPVAEAKKETLDPLSSAGFFAN